MAEKLPAYPLDRKKSALINGIVPIFNVQKHKYVRYISLRRAHTLIYLRDLSRAKSIIPHSAHQLPDTSNDASTKSRLPVYVLFIELSQAHTYNPETTRV